MKGAPADPLDDQATVGGELRLGHRSAEHVSCSRLTVEEDLPESQEQEQRDENERDPAEAGVSVIRRGFHRAFTTR